MIYNNSHYKRVSKQQRVLPKQKKIFLNKHVAFGTLTGNLYDDIFANYMNAMNMKMCSMNRLMNCFMPDPLNMLTNK